MKQVCFKLLYVIILFIPNSAICQKYYVSGTVTDASTGEYLPLATIYDNQIKGGTLTNTYGFFSLKLQQGVNNIEFSYVGYEKQRVNIHLFSDTTIHIQMLPNVALSEVKVFAESNQNRLRSTKVSSHVISAKGIQALPTLLGETDILKQLRTLPGVNAGADGVAGLIVRGSGPDENLVLYDGVPIYNINHLNSFFSVFNTDALAHAEIYKGAYPARYGGRISSVIDVRMREGNLKKFTGKISVGTIASKLTLEGPIIKDKSSFILSARRTYLDLFALPVQYFLEPYETTNYVFDDYNLKLNYLLNRKNRFFVSAYLGKDKFSIKDKYNIYTNSEGLQLMDWGNAFVSTRWNREFGKNTFLNITAYYYKYNYFGGDEYRVDAGEGQSVDAYKNINNTMLMHDWGFNANFDFSLSNTNYIRYGANYIYHKFLPNEYSNYEVKVHTESYDPVYVYSYDTVSIKRSLGNIGSHECHAFIEDELSLGALVKLNVGIHYSAFITKDDFYNFLMPRVSMVYMPTSQLSIKLASGKYSQYAFLISNPTIGMPTDIWIQSVNGLKPMVGWQTVLGAIYNTKSNLLFDVQFFYKKTKHVAEFKEMVQFDLFNDWNNIIEQGVAQNYGFETMAEIKKKKYGLKLSYSHIRAIRKFDEINNGNAFNYSFDSPHNINIEGKININDKIDLGFNWVYASGKLITLVEQSHVDAYYFDNEFYLSFYNTTGMMPVSVNGRINAVSQRNNHRLPAYHRLDVGVNFKKEKRRGERVWSFGVYNAYYRKNVYYIENWGDGYKQFSITPIVPYVSYSFKF